MRNLSYENEFYSQVHSNANHTHFHMKDFALGLGLKQRQKATRKWPISERFELLGVNCILLRVKRQTGSEFILSINRFMIFFSANIILSHKLFPV